MIGIGVIGYGYWGPNLVRNFAECRGAAVRMVCDLRPERLAAVERRYPGVAVTTDARRRLSNDPAVDAVVIATPVDQHFELAHERAARGQARAGREADGVDERPGEPADRRGRARAGSC